MLRTTVSRALKEALLTSEAIQTKGSKYFYSLVYLITWQNRRYCYYSRGCHTIFSTRILEKKMAFLLHKTKPVYTKEDIMLRTTVSRLLRRPILSDRGRKNISISSDEQMKLEQEINATFAEAREEIEAAMESVGTTYFNDDAEIAKELTRDCVAKYEELLTKCEGDVGRKEKIQRSMGLKIEQLKAECNLIDTAHDD